MSVVETKRQEDAVVMACPLCGAPRLHSCSHGGGMIRSIEMPISRAIDLMDDEVERMASALAQAQEDRQQLVASMMDWED